MTGAGRAPLTPNYCACWGSTRGMKKGWWGGARRNTLSLNSFSYCHCCRQNPELDAPLRGPRKTFLILNFSMFCFFFLQDRRYREKYKDRMKFFPPCFLTYQQNGNQCSLTPFSPPPPFFFLLLLVFWK